MATLTYMSESVDPIAALPGVFAYAEARRKGVTDRRLAAARKRGDVHLLGRGLYRHSGVTANLDLLEVVARAPEATLCLGSALAHHGLSDEIPSVIDIALPRSRRQPSVGAPVRWHRFDPRTFAVGRKILELGDLNIGLYNAERSICDAFRMQHLEGSDQAVEALKRWLRRSGSQPSELLAMARRFGSRAEAPIRTALEILL